MLAAPRVAPGAVTLGVLLIVLAWWQVVAAGDGLTIEHEVHDGLPLTWIAPDGGEDLPAVVVVHGFAGSRQLMSTWAVALAGAGYGVMLPDLPGHGANVTPLDRDDPRALADAVDLAVAVTASRPEVDAGAIALLGHSMGSGAVLRAGVDDVDQQRAVIAVSPTDADVDDTRPPNLLLLAGEFEPRFVANARDLLERAGGAGGTIAEGTARRLRIVPGVEHVSILFSPTAHRASAGWLADTLDGGAAPSRDLRLLWWVVHLAGWLLLWRARGPMLVAAVSGAASPPPGLDTGVARGRPLVALLVGTLVAVVGLAGLGRLVDVGTLGGMLVGPGIGVWFLLAGVVWLWLGRRPGRPSWPDLGWAALVLAVITVAVGILAHRVWLPWWPTPPRLALLPVLWVLLVPWSVALGATMADRPPVRVLGWWAAASAAMTVGLGAASLLVPGLGFVILVLPLLPALLGLLVGIARVVRRPWAVGMGLAGGLAWTIAVLFPMV